jgi:hypothetical protein
MTLDVRVRAWSHGPASLGGADVDEDLDALDEQHLREEVRRLRAGIREHRDSTGHDLCWHHPDLWALLPEQVAPSIAVPGWPQFLRGCVAYRQSLDDQVPDAPRVTQEYSEAPAAHPTGP